MEGSAFMLKAALARPGAWPSLLGSFLTLIAFFFLPYANPPPGSIIPPGSLWHAFILMVFQHHNMGFSLVMWSAGVILLLLFSSAGLAILALFLYPPRWKIKTIYLWLTTLTLIYYLFAALSDLFNYWFQATLAGGLPISNPELATLNLINIGALLIPVGLLLALAGGILLERRELKADS
jgi:hypothetical protein